MSFAIKKAVDGTQVSVTSPLERMTPMIKAFCLPELQRVQSSRNLSTSEGEFPLAFALFNDLQLLP